MKTTNGLESLLISKFPTYADYENFVLEFDSDAFIGKHGKSNQVLLPCGKNTWVTCRVIHKQEIPETTIQLPDTVQREIPVTMIVCALQNKFSEDLFKVAYNKATSKPDEVIVAVGEILIVSPAGCVPIPGYDGVVLVNMANIMAGISVEHIDAWYYEYMREE